MLSRYKLPFGFEANRLQSDLERILPSEWRPHFNRQYYEGEWKGLALRSTTGYAKEHIRLQVIRANQWKLRCCFLVAIRGIKESSYGHDS